MSENIFKWKFNRLGGIDQVMLCSGEEICRLRELDPKLWMALSCPAHGLELETRLLELIDTDKDGRIRVPEVLAAVDWVCARLKDPATMIDAPDVMPLAVIDDSRPEGLRAKQTAQAILVSLGKADATAISAADMQAALSGSAGGEFNGDGILPPLPTFSPAVQQFIQVTLNIIGGLKDGSGQPGININIAEALLQTLKDWRQWEETVSGAGAPLGPDTSDAWTLMQELKPKFDDYFLRCELASYAPQSTETLNPPQDMFVQHDNAVLLTPDLKDFPLSRVAANRPLDLEEGLNPAWRASVERFLALTSRYLNNPHQLTRENWLAIQQAFANYGAIYAEKPDVPKLAVEFPPTQGLGELGAELINSLLDTDVFERFRELAEKDASFPAPAADIADLERLLYYHCHLHRLLLNFVSFHTFYALKHEAAFQAGTLYIDGKSCLLCVPVSDINAHSALAGYSELFLLYLQCTRKAGPGTDEPEGERLIAAAITSGSSDLLIEGRNGVFIDNQGFDWDAQVVKVISKPINLRDAVWEPYKKFAGMISDQISKFATSKQQNMFNQAEQSISAAVQNPATPVSGGGKFDIARSAGIFAAIGLALGALGTALASLARAAFSLEWWQFPLVILGVFLIISGPSVIIAWLKLRVRTLGPLLEASGWATNNRLPINISLANKLTFTAKLPANAQHSAKDPLHNPRRWPIWALLAALLISAIVGWLWFYNSRDISSAVEKAASGIVHTVENSTQPKPGDELPVNK